MTVNSSSVDDTRSRRIRRLKVVAVGLAVAVVAALAGVMVGQRLVAKGISDERYRRLDESVGLGERTGIAGDLLLDVSPVRRIVRQGEPAQVTLTLRNRSKKSMSLNNWLDLYPADFGGGQFPLKIVVMRAGKSVRYVGHEVVREPHERRDFRRLGPGDSFSFKVDLRKGVEGGEWDMSAPGDYRVEIWYESYLTGRYAGVSAWTGMTNHVVAQVQALPQNRR